MAKSISNLLIPAAALGAIALTGGAAAPALAGAASGAGATGAGLGLAGDALAAQGAAGLLGSTGAAAAGFGSPIAGAGLGSIAGAGVSELPSGMAAFGPNGEYTGATIASDGLSANSFTGGFDALNPLQRGMQRLGGMDFNSNGMKMAKTGMDLMGKPQYQQAPQNVSSNAQVSPRQQMVQNSPFVDSSNMSPEEIKRKRWLQYLGNPNA